MLLTHRPRMMKQAMKLCAHNQQQAEDLVQDAIERGVRANPDPLPDKPGAWLARIMENVFIDWVRQRRRRPAEVELPENLLQLKTMQVSVSDAEKRDERAKALRKAVNKLSPLLRETLRLHYFVGLSYAAIGRRLGIPEGTVGKRLADAREKLEAWLAPTILDAE